MKMPLAHLVAHLEAMQAAVLRDDSLEGFLRYAATEEPTEFEVEAFYRVGNREGQGGCVLIKADDSTAVPSRMRMIRVLGYAYMRAVLQNSPMADICVEVMRDLGFTDEQIEVARREAGARAILNGS
jgi:hypothetical protein